MAVVVSWCFLVLFPCLQALSVFSPPNGQKLEKIATHPQSGTIYVSAVNAVYQLTKDLEAVQEYITGPKPSGDCLPLSLANQIGIRGSACLDGLPLKDSHTHLMIVNENDNTLIICNTVDAGTCNLHDSSDISRIAINSSEILKRANSAIFHPLNIIAPVAVSTSDKEFSRAVITTNHRGDSLLVVATLRHFSQKLRFLALPFITVRNLSEPEMLKPVGKLDFYNWRRLHGDYHYPRQSFTAPPYVYFTSIQESSSSDSYKTVLSRVCMEDTGIKSKPIIDFLRSYMEADIACRSSNGTMYKYLTAQSVTYPGASLRMILNLSPSDGVLLAAFAQEFDSIKDEERGPSVVCMFLLNEMEQQFRVDENRCRAGNGTMELTREGISFPCSLVAPDWSSSRCSPDDGAFVYYDEVRQPIESAPLWYLPSSVVSSTASTVVGKKTILFVGTDKGRIVKVRTTLQQNNNSLSESQQY